MSQPWSPEQEISAALAEAEATLKFGPQVIKPPRSASSVKPDFEVYVPLEGLVDFSLELKRLEKQIAEKKKHLQAAQAKLDNPNFRDKAPGEVVAQQRAQVEELQKQIEAMETNLRELRG